MFIKVAPVSKPRMTQQDKWKQRPVVMKYRAYKDQIRESVSKSFEESQVVHWLVFVVEMPKSWSNKKRAQMDGQPHQQRPDIDNFIKGYFDAIAEEDSHIYEVHALKVWGTKPGIYLGVDDYASISKTIKKEEKRQSPEQKQEKLLARLGRQGNPRLRGVSPRIRRR